jgi:hypothetical protein
VKNTYTLTVKVADRLALADLLDAIGPYAQSAEISIANGAPKATASPFNRTVTAPLGASKARSVKTRGPKRSKVNDTIRNALKNGATRISDLKDSLVAENLSAASLSTGIAALTKSGEIERIGDGLYALKAA